MQESECVLEQHSKIFQITIKNKYSHKEQLYHGILLRSWKFISELEKGYLFEKRRPFFCGDSRYAGRYREGEDHEKEIL